MYYDTKFEVRTKFEHHKLTPVAKVLRQICYIYISHQRDRFFFLSLLRDRALKELQFNIQQII